MNKILSIIGFLSLGYLAANAAGTGLLSRIKVDFKGLKLGKLSWSNSNVKATMLVGNNLPTDLIIEDLTGSLIYGSISTPVKQSMKRVVLEPGQTTLLSFTVAIDNQIFFEQIAATAKQGVFPTLQFSGTLSAGVADKVVSIPVNREIPLL